MAALYWRGEALTRAYQAMLGGAMTETQAAKLARFAECLRAKRAEIRRTSEATPEAYGKIDRLVREADDLETKITTIVNASDVERTLRAL